VILAVREGDAAAAAVLCLLSVFAFAVAWMTSKILGGDGKQK
jgi:hypothetical protein